MEQLKNTKYLQYPMIEELNIPPTESIFESKENNNNNKLIDLNGFFDNQSFDEPEMKLFDEISIDDILNPLKNLKITQSKERTPIETSDTGPLDGIDMENLYKYVKAFDNMFKHKQDITDILSILFEDSDTDMIDDDDDNNDQYNDTQITFDLFADTNKFIPAEKILENKRKMKMKKESLKNPIIIISNKKRKINEINNNNQNTKPLSIQIRNIEVNNNNNNNPKKKRKLNLYQYEYCRHIPEPSSMIMIIIIIIHIIHHYLYKMIII